MKNYILKCLDNKGQEQKISFSGEINFNLVNALDLQDSNIEEEQQNAFSLRLEEPFSNYDDISNTGLSYLNKMLDIENFSNYEFAIILDGKEYYFYKVNSFKVKRYTIFEQTEENKKTLNNSNLFEASLELM